MAERFDRVMASPWVTRMMLVFTIGTCMNFAGLGVAIYLIRGQAHQGDLARKRQQAVYPVSMKLYEDAARRGVISRKDLECFRMAENCPASK